MADSLTTLQAALANVEAQILALSVVPPIDYALDGESVNVSLPLWKLLQMQAQLRAAIIAAEGPVEIQLQGTT